MKTRLASSLAPLVVALALAGPSAAALEREASEDLGDRLQLLIEQAQIPGLAAAILVDGEIARVEARGWADIASRRPMQTSTVLNVGSVSKLVTSTAVLQLWEDGKIELDADVNEYLPFTLRHPAGGEPITIRQLLTHASGIQDGPSYDESYACGDPAVSLEDWLSGYLVPGGAYYSSDNFLDDAPGTTFEYSNVGYGLLGLIAQRVAGRDFAALTRERIFAPLGMESTGWFLGSVAVVRHATPYWIEGVSPDLDPAERALLAAKPGASGVPVPFCLYGFFNYPDGLLRTTITDLAAFVLATLPGEAASHPLLSQATREQVFSNQLSNLETDGRFQGLGWRRNESKELGVLWGHGGADPGIRAHVLHRPADGVTVLVMANSLVVEELRPILALLFEEGARLSEASFDSTEEK